MSAPRLCTWLRWKGFYGQRWASRDELAAAFARNDSAYSCLHTCQPWGPDDDLVVPERCGSERSCFQPSELEPRDRIA